MTTIAIVALASTLAIPIFTNRSKLTRDQVAQTYLVRALNVAKEYYDDDVTQSAGAAKTESFTNFDITEARTREPDLQWLNNNTTGSAYTNPKIIDIVATPSSSSVKLCNKSEGGQFFCIFTNTGSLVSNYAQGSSIAAASGSAGNTDKTAVTGWGY